MSWVLLLIAAAVFLLGIRVIGEHERVAVHRLGRFVGLKTPGLRYRMPGDGNVWQRLHIGMRGKTMSPSIATFGESAVPIESASPIEPNQYVRVHDFADAAVVVTLDPDQRGTLRCERCGHENEIH